MGSSIQQRLIHRRLSSRKVGKKPNVLRPYIISEPKSPKTRIGCTNEGVGSHGRSMLDITAWTEELWKDEQWFEGSTVPTAECVSPCFSWCKVSTRIIPAIYKQNTYMHDEYVRCPSRMTRRRRRKKILKKQPTVDPWSIYSPGCGYLCCTRRKVPSPMGPPMGVKTSDTREENIAALASALDAHERGKIPWLPTLCRWPMTCL
jgi:hypothetical protein